MKPKKIKIEKDKLQIIKQDDTSLYIDIKYLRDECPCADCKGETILFKTYLPEKPAVQHPDMYKVSKIELVGGYAIQITWKDGHDTGIYSWEYLEQLFKDQQNSSKQEYDKLV